MTIDEFEHKYGHDASCTEYDRRMVDRSFESCCVRFDEFQDDLREVLNKRDAVYQEHQNANVCTGFGPF
jgi:hypothetical protein